MGVTLIAEVGSVHDGSFGNALRLIDAAADCGVNVVKFQTHIASAETLRDAPTPPYFTGEDRFSYFERTSFSEEQWLALRERCKERDVGFLSSPFSVEAVELLERIGVEAYKIASGEVTNLPLIDAVASTGKPVYLSSGMSSWGELDAAVEAVLTRHSQVAVMQCTSEYPCVYEHVGLNVLVEMRERYGLPVGLSDHTLTNYAAFAAVSLGASVIERHFTLSRRMYGSDAPHSLEPAELADCVAGVRAIETMLAAPVVKDDLERFRTMKTTFEKSVVSLCEIAAGAVIDATMVGVKKPGSGLPAARLHEVVGRRARRAIQADSLLSEEDVEWGS